MAIAHLVLTCDFCEHESGDYTDEVEAKRDGWLILQGADWLLGGEDERVFCNFDCLRAWV